MKNSFLFVILSLLMLTDGCNGNSRKIDSVLNRADTLIFVAPDSAVRLLDSLDTGEASHSRQAHRALLLTKAREKAYVTVTDDSLISFATEYYRGRGDSLEVQSLFYRGVILGYRGDLSESLVSLMEAADRAAAIGDDFYLGMAVREQADVYTKLYEFEQAARCNRLAIEAFIRAGRPLHAAWERVYLAQALVHSGNAAEAYDSIRTLAADSIVLSNPGLLQEFFFIACNVAYANKYWGRSEEYYNKLLANGRIPESKLLTQMAKVKLRLGNSEEAIERGQWALESAKDRSDTAAYLTFMSDYYKNKGDFRQAYICYYNSQQDNITQTNRLIAHPFTARMSDYYHISNNENLLKKKAAENRNLILALSVLLLILSILALWHFNRRRHRRIEAEKDILHDVINNLEARINLINMRQDALSTEKSFSMSLVNAICEARGAMLSGDDGLHRFGKSISDIIHNLTEPSNLKAMEAIVNSSSDNLMDRFVVQVSGLTDRERTAAIFIFLGFSNTSIAAVMQYKSSSNVRQLRHKIKSRILMHPSADSKLFLSYFDTTNR